MHRRDSASCDSRAAILLLFGRGAEEAEALRDAGVAFESWPGISSALASPPTQASVTKRGLSSSVAVVTARAAVTAPRE